MKRFQLTLLAGCLALVPSLASAHSLLDIFELARENDPQLKAQAAAFRAGEEEGALARAALLPNISASAGYTHTDTDLTDRIDPDGSAPLEETERSWSITLSQTLFDLSDWYDYQAGKKRSERAAAEFAANEQELIVRVAEAYFNVLRAIDQLEATRAEERALEKQLEQTEQRFEVGLTAVTEVHEAQAAYDSAAAARLRAEGDLHISYEALEVLTGEPHDRIAPLEEDFPVTMPEPADRHEWVQFALENNYELKAASLNAKASQEAAKSSRAGRLPSLSGNVGYSDTNRDGAEYFGTTVESDTRRQGTRFGVTLEVPIFSGGAQSARQRQASAQHMQAREQFTTAQRNVVQSARSYHLSVETGVSQVKAQQQAIVSSESALEATQSGYEVGTRNLVEVLMAQRAVYDAQRNYANALYDYVIDTIRLREVAGMLSPADVQQIDQWLADSY